MNSCKAISIHPHPAIQSTTNIQVQIPPQNPPCPPPLCSAPPPNYYPNPWMNNYPYAPPTPPAYFYEPQPNYRFFYLPYNNNCCNGSPIRNYCYPPPYCPNPCNNFC